MTRDPGPYVTARKREETGKVAKRKRATWEKNKRQNSTLLKTRMSGKNFGGF